MIDKDLLYREWTNENNDEFYYIFNIFMKKSLYLYPIIYKISKDAIELLCGGTGCIHYDTERVGKSLRLCQILLLELFGNIL